LTGGLIKKRAGMKIYAISDTHFGHDRLQHMGAGRPADFGERILENLVKTKGDLLIHCGDFCIGEDQFHATAFQYATAGFKRRILVRGNHDKKSDSWYLDNGFDFVCERFVNTYFGKKVLFTHIPVLKTDEYDFNVHGHLHGGQHRAESHAEFYDRTWHKDLAPEIHKYAPVNIERLLV